MSAGRRFISPRVYIGIEGKDKTSSKDCGATSLIPAFQGEGEIVAASVEILAAGLAHSSFVIRHLEIEILRAFDARQTYLHSSFLSFYGYIKTFCRSAAKT
jgi:hypothetical protein